MCWGKSGFTVLGVRSLPETIPASDLEDVLFFFLDNLVDLLDIPIGDFLDLILAAMQFVFRNHFLFLELLGIGYGIPADVADSDFAFFPVPFDDLDKLNPPLLGEGGGWESESPFHRCWGSVPDRIS